MSQIQNFVAQIISIKCRKLFCAVGFTVYNIISDSEIFFKHCYNGICINIMNTVRKMKESN